MVRWVDRNLWSIPVVTFILIEACMITWQGFVDEPILLARATPGTRQAIYSSLTGSSSALLGFSIAAVTILAAFGQKQHSLETAQILERHLSEARNRLMGALLTASLFLLLLLVTATCALAIDSEKVGSSIINALIFGSAGASLLGLVVGGLGLALAVVERSRS